MKKIVTHTNPDLDAVTSAWLIKRFLPASPAGGPGWKKATVEFVTSSRVTNKKDFSADSDPDVLWVDIGLGRLDHHHTGEYLSATRLTWDYIQEQRAGQPLGELESEAVEELVEIVTEVDNARDIGWPEVTEFRYYLQLHNLIDGLRGGAESDGQALEFGMRALDAVLWQFKNKIKAEKELATGREFETPWGKGIAVITGNKQVLWLGEIKGYVIVVKRDPETGAVRIHARPDSTVDLTIAYNRVREADPESDWFLHASRRLLLNQSSLNSEMRPTRLDLTQIIKFLKNE